MELQEGVNLHFIESSKFTTNRIRVRFAAAMSEKTVAGRVLLVNLLEMGNQDYPTARQLRMKLAALYGAHFSTSVSKRGRVHFVDVNISYVKSSFLLNKEDITLEIIDFLYACLFRPLTEGKAFNKKMFEVEKRNLLSFLESEVEDNFYHADVEMSRLYFNDEDIQVPRVARIDLVQKETAESVYEAYKRMLKMDRIDIFIAGEVNQLEVQNKFKNFDFTYRNPKLELEYSQDYSNIVHEKVERKVAQQSILELAYHLQVVYNDVNYPALLVFNGLFGAFSHSKLFMNVREKESLAYTIGSQVDVFSGMLKVYAGINREDRLRTMKLINREFLAIKRGQITEDDLELTKKSLTHSAMLAQDRQNNLIEQAYNEVCLGERNLTWQQWIDRINAVSIDDVVKVGKVFRLQAIYFMEGVAQ